jgi:hypothetical protein
MEILKLMCNRSRCIRQLWIFFECWTLMVLLLKLQGMVNVTKSDVTYWKNRLLRLTHWCLGDHKTLVHSETLILSKVAL